MANLRATAFTLAVALATAALLPAQERNTSTAPPPPGQPAVTSAPTAPPRTGEFRAPADSFRRTFSQWLDDLFFGDRPSPSTRFSDFRNSQPAPAPSAAPVGSESAAAPAAAGPAITGADNITQTAGAIPAAPQPAAPTFVGPLFDASAKTQRSEFAPSTSHSSTALRFAPAEDRRRGHRRDDGASSGFAAAAFRSLGGAPATLSRPIPLPAPLVTEVPSLESWCNGAAHRGAVRMPTEPKRFGPFSPDESPGAPSSEPPAADPSITSIVLSTFSGAASDGKIISTTTWSTPGNVTQNAGSITIGGTALNQNGWGVTGLTLDASGMSYLNITAQRLPGNAASSLFVQFEDRNLATHVVSLNTSLFGSDLPTLAQVALGLWAPGFDATQITGWSIGGGGLGTADFRMTLDHVELSASAIPEPSTYAAVIGLAALAAALYHRRRR